MKTLAHTLLLIAVAALVTPAFASKTAGISYKSGGAAVKRNAATSTPRFTTTKRRPSMAPSRHYGSKSKATHRSILRKDGPQPSPRVAQIIREREASSGPGWIGTAFLVAMLSQHDLTSSDRRWIQSRIDDARAAGEEAEADPLLSMPSPKVRFRFDGVEAPLFVGKKASVSVSAEDGNGKALPLSCEAPAAGAVHYRQGISELTWTPMSPGIILLSCSAGGRHERRMLRVITKEPS